MAKAIQTCQCEKNPFEMRNEPVHSRSAVRRHKPKTKAINAVGDMSATRRSAVSSDALMALPKNAWIRSASVELVSPTADAPLTSAGCKIAPILVTDILYSSAHIPLSVVFFDLCAFLYESRCTMSAKVSGIRMNARFL